MVLTDDEIQLLLVCMLKRRRTRCSEAVGVGAG